MSEFIIVDFVFMFTYVLCFYGCFLNIGTWKVFRNHSKFGCCLLGYTQLWKRLQPSDYRWLSLSWSPSVFSSVCNGVFDGTFIIAVLGLIFLFYFGFLVLPWAYIGRPIDNRLLWNCMFSVLLWPAVQKRYYVGDAWGPPLAFFASELFSVGWTG